MARVLVIGGLASSLVNFRGDFITALRGRGHEVIGMAAPTDAATVARIEALGISFRPYHISRSGMDPRDDAATFWSLRRGLQEVRPDVVFAYTIKPVIWGGLALRSLRGAARYFPMITGLGLALQAGGVARRALTSVVVRLYRSALTRAERVFFQNPDDQRGFNERRIVEPGRCRIVNGSGVNLQRFPVVPLPDGPTVFLMIARLLRAKGLREYVEAASIVKRRTPSASFRLLGPEDPSSDGVRIDDLRSWAGASAVEYLGQCEDVRPHLAGCHVYVLPSYHEGMPRTVLEAMSAGRAIVTTDASGCRETVVPGENGLLVPVKNGVALAEALGGLVSRPDVVAAMGAKSRARAEECFDVQRINRELMSTMGLG